MKITRYLNGKIIKEEELKNIVIDSQLIHEIIGDVNRRLKNNCTKEHSDLNLVEKKANM